MTEETKKVFDKRKDKPAHTHNVSTQSYWQKQPAIGQAGPGPSTAASSTYIQSNEDFFSAYMNFNEQPQDEQMKVSNAIHTFDIIDSGANCHLTPH